MAHCPALMRPPHRHRCPHRHPALPAVPHVPPGSITWGRLQAPLCPRLRGPRGPRVCAAACRAQGGLWSVVWQDTV